MTFQTKQNKTKQNKTKQNKTKMFLATAFPPGNLICLHNVSSYFVVREMNDAFS
jgi:hypothetical protein